MRSPVFGPIPVPIPVPSLPAVRSSADLPALLAYVVECGRLSAWARARCRAHREAAHHCVLSGDSYLGDRNASDASYFATAIREYNRAARGAAALYNTLSRRWCAAD